MIAARLRDEELLKEVEDVVALDALVALVGNARASEKPVAVHINPPPA